MRSDSSDAGTARYREIYVKNKITDAMCHKTKFSNDVSENVEFEVNHANDSK